VLPQDRLLVVDRRWLDSSEARGQVKKEDMHEFRRWTFHVLFLMITSQHWQQTTIRTYSSIGSEREGLSCIIQFLIFFDKEHILILKRYQLHSTTISCSNSNRDAYNKKKNNYIKEKSRYNDQVFVAAASNITKTTLDLQLLKKQRLQEETMHKCRCRLIINLNFHPKKSPRS
jgi:hypothetical protein